MSIATRRNILRGALFGAACACTGARIAYAADNPPKSPTGKWFCPPCGCPNDGKEFDAPGECPSAGCGMTLIPAPAPKAGASLVGGS